MSRTSHEPIQAKDERIHPNNTQDKLLNIAYHAEISRRDALRAVMASAAAAVLFGVPRNAFGASASKKTLDALASAEQQLSAVQAQLDALGAEFEALSIEQDKTISQIEEVQAKLDETQLKIEENEAKLAEKQEALGNRVSDSYKKGPASTLNLLLSAKTFDELLSNSRYVDKINDTDRQIITEIQDIRAELEQQKADLEQQKTELEALKEQQAAQLAEMQAKQAEIKAVLDDLSQDVKDLIAQRDAEYLAAVQEEERQRQEAEANRRPSGGGTITGGARSLERVLSSAHATPSPGGGLCAMWVSQVFYNAGFGYAGGNANDQYNAWCTSSNRNNLSAGMIVAVSTHPHTAAGIVYGHVGIYMGNGVVMDNIGYIRSISLNEWISYYGATVTPRWGWLGGWVLQ
ncbi:coiled-coil domain-containing protein [Collinsella provencensis]|uniref:coiled-coil domain-containing protein n=1 Tax=Collinsella provencensis TaxID=1937461 RepID=UPI001F43A0D0|nr:CHAP domain-containing protein [Collinsella provencensis]